MHFKLKKLSQNAWNIGELNSKYFYDLNQLDFCSTFWFGHMYVVEFVWDQLVSPSVHPLHNFLSFLSTIFCCFFHPLYNFIFLFFSWVSFQGVFEMVVVNIYACEVQNHLCVRVVAFLKYGHIVVNLGPHPPPPNIFGKSPPMNWPFIYFWLQPSFSYYKTWDETTEFLVM